MPLLKVHLQWIKAILSAALVVIATGGAAQAQTRVCNTGNAEIFYARVSDTSIPQVQGWFSLAPGACMRDTSFGFWLAFVQRNSAGEEFDVDYGVSRPPDAYHSRRRFCVKYGARFTHNMLWSGSCPSGFDLVQFSLHVPLRDRGLLGAFTRIDIPSRADIVPEPAPRPSTPAPNAQTGPAAASESGNGPRPGSVMVPRDWLLIAAGMGLSLVLAGGALVARRGVRPGSLARTANGAWRAGKRVVAAAAGLVILRMLLVAFGLMLGQIAAVLFVFFGVLPEFLYVPALVGGPIVVGAAAAAAETWVRGRGKTLAALFLSGSWTMTAPASTFGELSYVYAAGMYAVVFGLLLIGWLFAAGVKYLSGKRARSRSQAIPPG